MARARARLASDPALSSSTAPRVHVQTLGACQIQIGPERLSPSAETVFAVAVRLVHAPAMQMSRDAMLRAFWPGQDEARQRGNLRQALYKLRRMGVLMEHGGDTVRLDPRQVARTFAIERTSEHFERDVVQGHEPFGAFLPGYDARGEEFREWIEQQRELVHSEVRRVLAQQLRGRRERADWHGAETMSRWLLQFDPLNEEATLTMAECLALSGSKAQAVELLDRYLEELGSDAGDIRVPATTLRRRLVDPGPRRVRFAPAERHFVGREEELAALTLAMRRARWHDGSAHLLHGPPGIGKTRLTQELAKVATIEGVLQLRYACRESDVTRPLSMAMELVSDLLTAPGALGCDPESLKHLRRLVGDEPVPLSADGTPMPREPLPSPAAIRRAVADIMVAVSEEKPVFLVVDDVHWLDRQSWDVLVDLIERSSTTRVCLLLTSRHAHACAERPERVPVGLEVGELGALSDVQSRQLVRAIVQDAATLLDERAETSIAETSQGLPLFVHGLATHWIQNGDLITLPASVIDVFVHRLASLSDRAHRLMHVISVAGEDATLDVVHRTLGLSTYECASALDELVASGLLEPYGNGLLVCHRLVSLASLSTVNEYTRRLLHDTIATILTDNLRDFTGSTLSILRHLHAAGSWHRFETTTTALVAHFDKRQDSSAILHVLELAFSLYPDLENQQALYNQYLHALQLTGRYLKLCELTRERPAKGGIEHTWDLSHPEDALRLIFAAAYVERNALPELCARALTIAESETVAIHTRAQAASCTIRLASDANTSDLADRAYRSVQNYARNISDTQRNLIDMYYHTVFGNPRQAHLAASAIYSGLHNIANRHERLRYCQDVAYAFRFCGSWARAESLFESNYEEAIEIDNPTSACSAAFFLSLSKLDRHQDIDEAKLWQQRLEMMALKTPERTFGVSVAFHAVRIHCAEGDAERARERMTAASQRYPEEYGGPRQAIYSLALRIRVATMLNDSSSLADLVAIARPLVATQKLRPANDFFFYSLIEGLMALRAPLSAKAVAAECLSGRVDPAGRPGYLEATIQRSYTG